jgi:hypothetical protein
MKSAISAIRQNASRVTLAMTYAFFQRRHFEIVAKFAFTNLMGIQKVLLHASLPFVLRLYVYVIFVILDI